ncbi:MAG TPA: nucleotidyltransferase [Gaiellaceae bacterium]|nr:nucleotidyltransferase [Gaiellaceae bacterium]
MGDDADAVSRAVDDRVDEQAFLDALEIAVSALERADVPYMVIGGLASAVYGRPRWTHDIDLFVKPEDARRALHALADAGFVTEETNPHWIFKAWRDGAVIDLIFCVKGDIYVDEEMLSRSRVAEIKGRRARVLPPEDLVVIKAIVHDEPSARHWHDALGVIAGTELDWEYLLRRAPRGARRVLSLLLYAQASDLVVPEGAIRDLFATIYG